MPSTFTTRLRLEKQADGENEDTWGGKIRTTYDLIDEAADGYLEKAVGGSSNVTLTSSNAASDESRQRVLKLTGTLTGNIDVIVPAVEKSYVVWNATSGSFSLTFKPSGGTGLVVPQGFAARVFTDGSTMFAASSWVEPTIGTGMIGVLWDIKTYTSDDTWAKPDGLRAAIIEAQAPGGGGGGTAATGAGESASAGSGGGGEYRRGRFNASTLGASETVTVPAGGAGGTAGDVDGTSGATASFGAHITCEGGRNGRGGATTSADAVRGGGFGGTTGAGGDVQVPGEGGGTGRVLSGSNVGASQGGSAFYGHNNASPQTAAAGANGGGFGSGGNGAQSSSSTAARPGGDGAPGLIRVWEFF